jgi:hypothetical protein
MISIPKLRLPAQLRNSVGLNILAKPKPWLVLFVCGVHHVGSFRALLQTRCVIFHMETELSAAADVAQSAAELMALDGTK